MPQVPYTPYPTAQPSNQGIGKVSVSTGAAFGENVAQSIQGFGKAIDGAGDELFKRALAMQTLKNETEAKEADANYMITAGKLHADFNALQGKDRVDAFPKYAKDLNDTRQQMRESLSNDATRKMYDGSSLSTMGRSIFNGAGVAAAAQKEWSIGTAKSEIALAAKTVSDNPKDDVLFQEKLDKTKEATKTLSGLQGLGKDSPQEKELTQKITSHMWANRIEGLSRVEPFEAAKVLDANKTNLTEDDYKRVDNTVRAQSRAVGSVNIANGVFEQGQETADKPAKPLAEMEKEVRDQAKAQNPDDPLLERHAVEALRGRYNQNNYAKTREDQDNQETIRQGILSGVKNEQELRANPKVAAAIDALHSTGKKLDIPGQINRYNAARDKSTNQEAELRLLGLSRNDREGFLNTDVTKLPLSAEAMNKWMKLQDKIKEKPDQDPRVNRALSILRGNRGAELEALKVFKRTDDNKDDFDLFTGTLGQSIDLWVQEHGGKSPSARDIIETIGPEVIQQRSEPGAIFGNLWPNKKPMYKQDVPDAWAEKIKADIISRGGEEPTKEQLMRAYIRSQLIENHEKKKKPNG